MDKIKITEFKESGKWYSEEILEVPEGLKVWDKEYERWLSRKKTNRNHVLLVQDLDGNSSFFTKLYIKAVSV